MDKEKEIEEMVDELSIELKEGMKDGSFWDFMYCVAEKMIGERGYRKADEVRKETAKEILCYLKATITDGLLKNHEILNALMKEYDIEV